MLGLVTFLGALTCHVWATYPDAIAQACTLMWLNTGLLLCLDYPLTLEPYGSVFAMLWRFLSLIWGDITTRRSILCPILATWTVLAVLSVVRALAEACKAPGHTADTDTAELEPV